MRKRMMVIGPSQSGKSTLVNVLNHADRPLKRTQDVIYGCRTIDTPGSYLENTRMYKYLIATAQTASHILVLVDQSNPRDVYSPGFAKIFNCPVIGVITKCDMNPENHLQCVRQLQRIGVAAPWFSISVIDGNGITELEEYLQDCFV